LPLSSNEFQTPDWVFDPLHREFNFQYDLACREHNKKLEKGLCYPKVNSLDIEWHKLSDGWLWLNPPYSPLKPWIQKAQREFLLGAKIVMLIPPILSTKYFSAVMPAEIRYITGRINFIGSDGKEMTGNSHDSALVIYGPPVMPKVSYIAREELRHGF
jgi:phage N-6-adenine-methyltransferase